MQYDLNHPTVNDVGAPPPGDSDAPSVSGREADEDRWREDDDREEDENDSVPDCADYRPVTLEAHSIVFRDREGDYGHPLDDFTRTAHYWTGHLRDILIPGAAIVAEDVGPMMCLLKLSRQRNKAKRDNMTDVCGYAETTERVIAERARRGRLAARGRVLVECVMERFRTGRISLAQVRAALGLGKNDATSV